LNALVLNKLYAQFPATHQTYTPFLVAAILAALGASLAMVFERHIIIGATAVSGAYMVGFGVDRLAFHTAHHVLNPLVSLTLPGHAGTCSLLEPPSNRQSHLLSRCRHPRRPSATAPRLSCLPLHVQVLASGGGCKTGQCYGVLAGMVVLAVVGWIVQLRYP